MSEKSDKIKQFLMRDRAIRVISKDGHFRSTIVNNTNSAKHAAEKHNISQKDSGMLAKALCACIIAASRLKGEERVALDLYSTGYYKKVFAEAMQIGEVRGYIDVNEDAGAETIAEGSFAVTKTLYNKSEPIRGIIPLQQIDITSGYLYYLNHSEQIPSTMRLDYSQDENGIITASGGVSIQAMPGAPAGMIEIFSEILHSAPPIDTLITGQKPLEEMLIEYLPFEFDTLGSTRIDFFCRCSKEKFIGKLMTFGVDDIREMMESGQNELVCRYCNNKYYIESDDFTQLIEEIQAKSN